MDQLNDIRVFVEVARTGSFIRAGEVLRHTSSAISKSVARLESSLGVMLFERTTRRMMLTEDGRNYFLHCERILNELEQANESILQRKNEPQGTLKVHLPLLWAREIMTPALLEFHNRYPKVSLQLAFSESRVDFRSGFDLCVQVGNTSDENLVERLLLTTRSITVASPAYLERAGVPLHPDDLARHECVRFMTPDKLTPAPWQFDFNGKLQRRLMHGAIDVSDPQGMLELALSGGGIVQGPDLLLRRHVNAGALIQVLQKWETTGPSIYLAWPRNRFDMPLRMRVFVDWLLEMAKRPLY